MLILRFSRDLLTTRDTSDDPDGGESLVDMPRSAVLSVTKPGLLYALRAATSRSPRLKCALQARIELERCYRRVLCRPSKLPRALVREVRARDVVSGASNCVGLSVADALSDDLESRTRS